MTEEQRKANGDIPSTGEEAKIHTEEPRTEPAGAPVPQKPKTEAESALEKKDIKKKPLEKPVQELQGQKRQKNFIERMAGIKVVGFGGAGCNAVSRMIEVGLKGV